MRNLQADLPGCDVVIVFKTRSEMWRAVGHLLDCQHGGSHRFIVLGDRLEVGCSDIAYACWKEFNGD